jgi:hypothetical protein
VCPDGGLHQQGVQKCLHSLPTCRLFVKGAVGANIRAEWNVNIEMFDHSVRRYLAEVEGCLKIGTTGTPEKGVGSNAKEMKNGRSVISE